MFIEIQGGQISKSNELKMVDCKKKKKKDPAWYAAGINKFVNRFKKCLAKYSDYVEK